MKREQSGNKSARPRSSSSAPRKSSSPRGGSSAGPRKSAPRGDGESRPYARKTSGDKPYARKTSGGDFFKKDGASKPYARKSSGDGESRPYARKTSSDRPYARKTSGDKPYIRKSSGDGESRPYARKTSGDKPYIRKSSGDGESRPYARKTSSDRPYARKTSGGDFFKKDNDGSRPYARRTSGDGESRPYARKTSGDKPYARKSSGDGESRPYERKTSSDRPYARKSSGDGERKSFGVKRGDAKVFPDKAKKAYGSADTYKDRKDTKSFHDKPDFEERAPGTRTRKARDFSEGTLGKGKFTKKSELKGIQPREVKEYSDDDFRFKTPGSRGKRLDLGKGKEFVSQSKSQSKERITEEALSIGESVRLNRFISNAGVCSRREADELIGAGLVSINGVVATELGTKVKAGDVVRFNGEKLAVEAKVYLVLNKPKDAITTLDDPDGRNTVMDIFEGKMRERVYPIGRLDRNTTGVLLLTNDGELAQRLMHPKYEIKKVYKATLNKNLKPTDLWSLSNGVELEDGFIKPDAIAQSDAKNKNVVGIEIHSGKNRIIHRMFEHLGYTVDKLDRVLYAGMEKGNLKRGEWRELNDKELKALKRSVHLK
jgi:23S rRNA pseudouridine2605 synthase